MSCNVKQVVHEWLVKEDQQLAERIHTEQIIERCQGNRQRNSQLRSDLPLAVAMQRQLDGLMLSETQSGYQHTQQTRATHTPEHVLRVRRAPFTTCSDGDTASAAVSHRNGDSISHRNGDSISHRNGVGISHRNGDGATHRNGDGVIHRNGDGISHRNGDGVTHINANIQCLPQCAPNIPRESKPSHYETGRVVLAGCPVPQLSGDPSEETVPHDSHQSECYAHTGTCYPTTTSGAHAVCDTSQSGSVAEQAPAVRDSRQRRALKEMREVRREAQLLGLAAAAGQCRQQTQQQPSCVSSRPLSTTDTDLSEFCQAPPAAGFSTEEEFLAWQEQCDAELARLIYAQEATRRGDVGSREHMAAQEIEDRELAKVLQEQERVRARRAREKLRRRRLLGDSEAGTSSVGARESGAASDPTGGADLTPGDTQQVIHPVCGGEEIGAVCERVSHGELISHAQCTHRAAEHWMADGSSTEGGVSPITPPYMPLRGHRKPAENLRRRNHLCRLQ